VDQVSARIAIALSVLAISGCGVLGEDAADFALRIPDKTLVLDASEWLRPPIGSRRNLPRIDCTADTSVCRAAALQYCGAGACDAVCDGENCGITVDVALWHTIDLSRSQPELRALESRTLAGVQVERVYLDVIGNSLGIATAPLTLSAGPKNVMSVAATGARRIGQIPRIAAGATGTVEVVTDRAGRDALARLLREPGAPFNVLVGGVVEFAAGDPLSGGVLTAVLRMRATARPEF
jgi:hypothetical protein